jgi:response regulator NasT
MLAVTASGSKLPLNAKHAAPQTTILLADDDRLILATLSQGLRRAGFHTVEASTGAGALKICLESPPDLAILDFNMPDMSGVEVAKTIHATAQFPVIFLSAYGDERIVQAAGEFGAMAYLLKPIDPPKLVPTIHTALQRFAELSALRGESQQLTSALQTTRATSIVVGLLMERLQLSEKQAYDRLRQYSRSNNRKVTDVAADILGATDRLNCALAAIGDCVVTTRKAGHADQDPGRP